MTPEQKIQADQWRQNANMQRNRLEEKKILLGRYPNDEALKEQIKKIEALIVQYEARAIQEETANGE